MSLPPLSIQEIYCEYVHRHQNKKAPMAAETGVLLFLSLTAVGLRFWSRKIQGIKCGWSDWTILFALVSTTVMVGWARLYRLSAFVGF